MLRDYQSRTIDQLYQWFNANSKGNPCLVLPTGAGKSHIIAALCKDALSNYPDTRILMLTHQKELIEQNAEKMLLHWPDAPLGIYSASIGTKNLNQITFAGIQSVRNLSTKIGHIDLIIIDEAHLVSHKAEGGYRKLIGQLIAINPSLRVVGLTASPFRLGHGLITDKPAIFDALIEPTSIEELIVKGYLATLQSKLTKAQLEVDGVHKRGGEYIESELQAKVNTKDKNESVVREVISLAGERKSWIFFCAGVKHAHDIAQTLITHGVNAYAITGETPKAEREQLLADFKAGKIRALTNANVLTTGFDAPNIDLIAMLRPTMSAGLYVQMAGRGLRVKDHTDHCLVLDFAGVVKTHGPITNIQHQSKETKGNGEAPVKVCDNCFELCHISAKVCPACATPFPEPKPQKLKLHNDDIMGLSGTEMEITSWQWKEHISRASGKRMLRIDYYGALSDPPITEYLTVTHEGWAGAKAVRTLGEIANKSRAVISNDLYAIIDSMNQSTPPSLIEYKKNGKYNQITKREWNEA
jgi:DNA repair protein RadD